MKPESHQDMKRKSIFHTCVFGSQVSLRRCNYTKYRNSSELDTSNGNPKPESTSIFMEPEKWGPAFLFSIRGCRCTPVKLTWLENRLWKHVFFQCNMNLEIIMSRAKGIRAEKYLSQWLECKQKISMSWFSKNSGTRPKKIRREPPQRLTRLVLVVFNLHSGNLTQQWKMDPLKMYFLLKRGIFHCYVSLPEGIWSFGDDFG